MAGWNMNFADAIQLIHVLKSSAKELGDQFDNYLDNMPLPESIDSCGRATIKMWCHHYINSVCSLESLANMLNKMGVGRLLELPPYQMEYDRDGNLKIYEVKEDGR